MFIIPIKLQAPVKVQFIIYKEFPVDEDRPRLHRKKRER